MAHIRLDGVASSASLFQVVFRPFQRAAVARIGVGAETDHPLTDERTLQAISRLSDEQLDDIGIRRKARLVRSDYLARSPCTSPIVKFDYFHKDS
jgi:hypothetical protein